MSEHALLPGVDFERMGRIRQPYVKWLGDWLSELAERVEQGLVSSSECVAGCIAETLVEGHSRTDWIGLMKDELESQRKPLAYSQKYGEQLNRFGQWKQSPVHAVYSRWWIERQTRSAEGEWDSVIRSFVQPSGWIYNPDVSPTGERTRMKSELFMSLAMGSEILSREGNLPRSVKTKLLSAAVSLPPTNYVSAEYFRFRSLTNLQETHHAVTDVDTTLSKCRTSPGFSDYSVADKIDDYMGVAKRTARDVAVFSPVSTLHALALASGLGVEQGDVVAWRQEVKNYLEADPFAIPALRMRDLTADFGEPLTSYEVIAAAHLIQG